MSTPINFDSFEILNENEFGQIPIDRFSNRKKNRINLDKIIL